MIIDVHCHLFDENLPSRQWWAEYIRISAFLSGTPEEKLWQRTPGWWDVSGDMLVQDMDLAGIDKSIILVNDMALAVGTGEAMNIEEQHKTFSKAAKKYPDRLIPFAGVDPRRLGAVDLFERAIKEWNMKGLKLQPAVGFYPNDQKCYLLYQKCVEFDIPVLIHTGPEIPPMQSKYGMPLLLDEVAMDFPKLKIIAAHAGACYWEEMLEISNNKTNFWLDLAWWQPKIFSNPVENFYKPLRTMLDLGNPERVLFASDWPSLRQVRRLGPGGKVWVDAFRNIPEEAKAAGIDFTEEEINGVLGGNAAKLLGL